ncbi:MAG: radical SAM protein [Methanoregula sp.]|uniref:radical SAM protein n=1 Tax=Methanoregula sp. TaxID=2052170 RepID=UPI003C4DA9B7
MGTGKGGNNQKKDVYSTPDDVTTAMAAVERWLGNPVSLSLLNFVATNDECGNRLSNAIDAYLGTKKDLCWKCRLAGKIVGYTLHKSSNLFGVDESEIRGGLKETVFRRGLVNVLSGIAHYGITRPQIVNAPFLVVWDFTHMCNLKCKHCYQDAQKALPGEISTDEAKQLIDQLSAAGVVVIAFSGGEPLMRKDFFEIARYAHEHDLYVALASNGTLITPEVAQKLHDAGVDYVEVSIDGKDAASHDAMRGISGAFDRSVEGIRNCVAQGIYSCIATTVTRENYDQVDEIYELGRKLGVKRMMCFNFIPTGRGMEMSGQDITPCQREDLLRFILTKDHGGTMPEILSTAPQFARVALSDSDCHGVPVGHFHAGNGLDGRTRMLADFIGGCGAGRLYCSIEPDGDVQPCVFMPITVGNVKEKPFLGIWHEAQVLHQLRDRSELEGHCAICENKLICGGCRARAWAYYGNLNAPDPGCMNNISYWNAVCMPSPVQPLSAPLQETGGREKIQVGARTG